MTLTRRRLAALAALLAAVLAAIALGLFPQEPLRVWLERRLRDAAGRGARIGGLRVVPGLLRVEVRDLTLEGPSYRVEVPRTRATLAARTLLGGAVSLRSVAIDSPRVLLRAATKPGGASAPLELPVLVESLDVARASLVYRDPALGGDVSLEGLDLHGSLGAGVLDVRAAGGTWDRARPLRLGPALARLRVSPLLDVRVEALEVGTEASRIRASGSLGPLHAPRPDLRLEGKLDLSDLAALERAPAAAGALDLSGRLAGQGERLSAELQLSGRQLEVGGWPLDRATARLDHLSARTTLSLAAELLGGRLDAEARLFGSASTGRVRLSAIDLDRLRVATRLGRRRLAGSLSGELRFEGDLTRALAVKATVAAAHTEPGLGAHLNAEASGTVRTADGSVDVAWTVVAEGDAVHALVRAARIRVGGTARGPWPPAAEGSLDGTLVLGAPAGPIEASLRGATRMRAGVVQVEIEARGLDGSVSASADVRGATFDRLALRGEALRLDPLVAGLHGVASFGLEASGPVGRLGLSGRGQLTDLAWGGATLGAVTARIEGRQDQANWTIDAPALHLSGRGQVRSSPSPTLTGTVALAATPLAPFSPLVSKEVPLEGALSATVDLEVPLEKPDDAKIVARVDTVEVESGRFSARATRAFTLGYREKRVLLEGLRVEGSGLAVEASGAAGVRASAPLEGRLRVDADLSRLPAPAGWAFAGGASGEMTLAGTVGRPGARGVMSASNVTLEGPTLPAVLVPEARLELAGDTARLSPTSVSVAGGSLTVEARLPLSWAAGGCREAQVLASWSGIEARGLLERLRPGAAAPLEAVLSGELRLEGNLASLRELRGSLAIPATTMQIQDLAVDVAPATVRLESGLMETEGITLAAAGGTFRVFGSVDMLRRTVDATGKGLLELRALAPFLSEASLAGTADVDLRLEGPLDSPRPQGTLAVRDGALRLRAIPQALTGIGGTLSFDGASARIDGMTAVLGGGTVTLEGAGRIEGATLSDVMVEIAGHDLALRYPEGFRSRVNADLALTGRLGAFRLAGTVRAQRGLYALDIALEESLLAKAPRKVESPVLRAIALDLAVETGDPVRVFNNVAQLEAAGRLVIRGDMETPAPVGHLEIVPGGKVFLQGRDFLIESGRLTYKGSWSPDLTLKAGARLSDIREENAPERSTIGEVEVDIEAEGPLEKPRLRFRSDPSYSEPEIVTMIATGRVGGQALASGKWIAGEQAAAVLAGRLSRSLTEELRFLGLDEVSIQPELVARETEPGARFTFGKRLSGSADLVYSFSLKDPEARFVKLEVVPGRDVALSVTREDDGTFTYGAGQRFRLGGRARPPLAKEQRLRLGEVRLEGDRPFEPETLRRMLRAEPGRKLSIWDLQEDADRLRESLIEKGYIEAEVGVRLEGEAAVFRVHSGARYRWRVEGMKDPPDLEGEIRRALFEEEALDRGRARLLAVARKRGHLRAVVAARAVPEGEGRTLLFTVEPGPVVEVAGVRFPGASAFSHRRLLRAAGGPGRILSEPEDAVKGVVAAYREKNYLAAEVDPPRVKDEAGRVRVVIPVREGAPARVAAVRFEGATRPVEELAAVAGLAIGETYSEGRVAAGLERVRDHYFSLGHPAIRVTASPVPTGSDLELVMTVVEGDPRVVGTIAVEGLSHTREWLVRRALDLHAGEPLDPRRLAAAERRLLDLGIFSRAAIGVADDDPATLRVEVAEDARLVTGYDFRYSDDDKAQVQVDLERRNLFGAGLAVGGRYRVGKDIREGRGSTHLPALGPLRDLTVSAFRTEEDLPAVDPFTQEATENTRIQKGFQVQQKSALPDRWNLLYGYRFERTVLLPNFPAPIDVAAVDVSLLRETRDDVLDARRGRFLSVTLEYSPAFLGSDFTFVKALAQAFVNRSLRSSWTWAQGYRLGLSHGFGGQRLISSERFKAGGAHTLRGFASDSVGPRDVFDEPTGGQAVVVLNQELRYRHRSGLGAVVFYDAGNVFPTIRSLSFDWRHSLGAGLRWDSPVGLLRLDTGIPLDREEGEKAYRLFFSLGQAF